MPAALCSVTLRSDPDSSDPAISCANIQILMHVVYPIRQHRALLPASRSMHWPVFGSELFSEPAGHHKFIDMSVIFAADLCCSAAEVRSSQAYNPDLGPGMSSSSSGGPRVRFGQFE